ncbi:YezD family protein [Bacillus sp. FJAT-45037]|nr:YezD family protein [Bacillus sp. FJAT-45037]
MDKQSEWQLLSKRLQDMLKDLKFGSVTIIVQDGKIVQLEKNEKQRLK